MYTLGNRKLLSIPSTAFLCSRKISAAAVLKCYDWAIEMRKQKRCVISGFHSPLEKDVFDILIKGDQPVIVALARGMKVNPEEKWKEAIKEGRLLIVTPFDESYKSINSHSAALRNKLMIDLASDVTVGYLDTKGKLVLLIEQVNKPVQFLTLVT